MKVKFLMILMFIFHSVVSDDSGSNHDSLLSLNDTRNEKQEMINIKSKKENNLEALLLFRSLELWMNLHLVRHDTCIERVMCEGISNIVNAGHSNDSFFKAKSISRVYAELSG